MTILNSVSAVMIAVGGLIIGHAVGNVTLGIGIVILVEGFFIGIAIRLR